MAEFLLGLITGGGLITVWKWVAGWNNVNLSLTIENRRTSSKTAERDDLVSVLKLKKGDRATLSLEHIRFSIASEEKEIGGGMVDDVRCSEVPRSLNVTPGEETQFAFHTLVPARAVCKITVTVTGRSLRTKHAQLGVWKITDFSVPIPYKGNVNDV